jgi:hypothetical protein
MKYKVVATAQGKVVIDETAKIKENTNTFSQGINGDWFYNSIYESIACTGDITRFDFKIIYTINFSLDKDIPMIVVEDGVEKLVKSLYEMEEGNVAMNMVTSEKRRAFKEGHKLAQQKGIYSEEDIRKAVIFGQSVELTFVTDRGKEILIEQFIESLKQEYMELEEIDTYYEKR